MSRTRRTVGSALAVLLPGCTSWHATTLPPRELIESEQPDVVRVTQTSGDQIVLREPSLAGDSIAGVWFEDRGIRIAVPLERVDALELPGQAAGGDLLITVLLAPVFVGLLILLVPDFGGS